MDLVGPFSIQRRARRGACLGTESLLQVAGQRLYRSAGGEALFDVHAFSIGQAIRAGVRYAYRMDYHNSRVEPFVEFGW